MLTIIIITIKLFFVVSGSKEAKAVEMAKNIEKNVVENDIVIMKRQLFFFVCLFVCLSVCLFSVLVLPEFSP